MDTMYYVKEKGTGLAGIELVDEMAKMQQMVDKNQAKNVFQ